MSMTGTLRCKIITYLESQTPSYLLTCNFHLATMAVKGRLLSSTAIVKRFQAENSKSIRVTGSPSR